MNKDFHKNLPFSIYTKIASQSRKPFFFNDLKIDSNFDGRLELLIFNLSLVLWSMKRFDELKTISQDVCDIFFQDLDNSLRELGVSDLSVGRKIKVLAENYFGRLVAYSDAFDSFRKNKQVDVVLKKIKKNFKLSTDQISSCPKFKKYIKENIVYFEKVELKLFKLDDFNFQTI